ncbi:MAG: hypothetical protein CMD16_02635 [Flavobacteriales bacterium]|nr:hypothetical protein [Flavobacteriales bacterium]|tara:strand:+ start:31827 stop:32549 length:723 start_codon:yes stop_codon:yes gene_type:complete
MRRVLIIFKWVLVTFLLLVTLSFTNERQTKQLLNLNKISIGVSEEDFINKQIILTYLVANNISFDSVLVNDFQIDDIEEILQLHPGIQDAEVYSNQKGDVNILVEQKKAIVRVKSNFDDCYLDKFGERMDLSENYTPCLLVATGKISSNNYKEIVAFVNEINKSDFWKSQLTQLHYHDDDDIILIPRVGKHKIHVGGLDNIKEKLDHLYQLYNVALPVKGWQTYSDINLKYKNQIICTKK